MQTTLIYNPHAGGAARLPVEALLAALRRAGYAATHRPTRDEHELDAALAGVTGLVVAAGGDGTLRAVASRLVGRDVSLWPLPLGTANNVCKALGIRGAALELIAAPGSPCSRPLDLGYVQGPWGESYTLEGLGFGLFAEALATYDPEAGKSVLRGVRAAFTAFAARRARRYSFALDGRDLSGEYLLVEVLNTPAAGPRLRLAPEADPGDGLLDVVCVPEGDRDTLLRYAWGLLSGSLADLPSVEVHRGRRLVLGWDGFPVHLDATPRRGRAGPPGEADELICLDVVPGALSVWLPGRR